MKALHTQLAFKYSLSIVLTSGNLAVNGEQISVITFSGVKEHLMCSNAAAFSSMISSPEEKRKTKTKSRGDLERREGKYTHGGKACTCSSRWTWVHRHQYNHAQMR